MAERLVEVPGLADESFLADQRGGYELVGSRDVEDAPRRSRKGSEMPLRLEKGARVTENRGREDIALCSGVSYERKARANDSGSRSFHGLA